MRFESGRDEHDTRRPDGMAPAEGAPEDAADGVRGSGPDDTAVLPGQADDTAVLPGQADDTVVLPGQADEEPGFPGREEVPGVYDAPGVADDASMMSAEAFDDMQAFRSLDERRAKKKRQKRIRLIVTLSVVAVLAVCAILVAKTMSSLSKMVAPADAVAVEKGPFTNTVTGSGALEPISSTIVTPEVDGIITAVNVSAGSTVNAGDVLFTLKNDALDQAVAQAAQQVKSAQNGVDSAQAGLQSARDNYASARDNYNAQKAAAAAAEAAAAANPTAAGTGTSGTAATTTGGTGAALVFDESTYTSAINQAQVGVDGAYIALETAQQAYDEAVAKTGKRTVTAPVSGSIVAMNATPGQQVGVSGMATTATSSGPLIQIADLSQMKVTIQVNEVDISKMSVGQTAKVTFSAVPDLTLEGTVQSIATVSSSASSSAVASAAGASGSGVVTYSVTLVIPKPDPRLKPGMTASVSVVTQQLEDVLTVPVAAVQTGDDGGRYVIVQTTAEDGTMSTENRPVKVKTQSSTQAVIEGSVQAGDMVQLSQTTTQTTEDAASSFGL